MKVYNKLLCFLPYLLFTIFSLASIGVYPLLGDNSQKNLTSREVRWPLLTSENQIFYSKNSYHFKPEEHKKVSYQTGHTEPYKYVLFNNFMLPIFSFSRTTALSSICIKTLYQLMPLKYAVILFNLFIGFLTLFITHKVFRQSNFLTKYHAHLILIPLSMSPNLILNYGPFTNEKFITPIFALFLLFYFFQKKCHLLKLSIISFTGIITKIVFLWYISIAFIFDLKRLRKHFLKTLICAIPIITLYLYIVPLNSLVTNVYSEISYVKGIENWLFGLGVIKNIIFSPRLLNTLFFEETILQNLSTLGILKEIFRVDLFVILNSVVVIFLYKKNIIFRHLFLKLFVLTIIFIILVITQGQNELNLEQQTFAYANIFPLLFSFFLYKYYKKLFRYYCLIFGFASFLWIIEYQIKLPPPELNIKQYEVVYDKILSKNISNLILLDQEDTGFFELLSRDKLNVFYVGKFNHSFALTRINEILPQGKSTILVRLNSTWSEERQKWPSYLFHNKNFYHGLQGNLFLDYLSHFLNITNSERFSVMDGEYLFIYVSKN